MSPKDTTRVQLELPRSAWRRLGALKERTEASSYAEVVKSALRLYERMLELTKNGDTLLVRDSKDQRKEVELML